MGYGGLCHVEHLCQVTDAYLRFKQHKEDSDPGGVAKYFKKLCKVVELGFLRHCIIYYFQKVFVDFVAVAAFYLFIYIFAHGVVSFLRYSCVIFSLLAMGRVLRINCMCLRSYTITFLYAKDRVHFLGAFCLVFFI